MGTVGKFGWLQGDGGGVPQGEWIDYSEMAKEDSEETMICRLRIFVLGFSICFTNSLELVLVLEREAV